MTENTYYNFICPKHRENDYSIHKCIHPKVQNAINIIRQHPFPVLSETGELSYITPAGWILIPVVKKVELYMWRPHRCLIKGAVILTPQCTSNFQLKCLIQGRCISIHCNRGHLILSTYCYQHVRKAVCLTALNLCVKHRESRHMWFQIGLKNRNAVDIRSLPLASCCYRVYVVDKLIW